MIRNIPILLVIISVILASTILILYKTFLTGNNNKDLKGASITSSQTSPAPEFNCPYDELRISELPPEVQSNEVAVKTIKDNCLWATAQLSDLNSDNKDEIVISGVGYGCGSCHANVVFIIDGDKVVFQYEGDDMVITPIASGFRLKEPIRKENEPLCCPSEYVVYEYSYYPEEGLYRSTNRMAPTGEIKPLSW